MNGKIISKGFYMHPGIPNFVSAKQYVIVRSGKENQLFFRFENPKNELLSAISFTVDCYDTEGRIAKSAKIEQSGLRIKGHDFFVVNRPVVLDTAYADFKVTINSVRYGDYLYITHGEDVEVVFEKQEDNHAIDRVPFLEMLGGRTHKAVSRVIHTPAFFVVLVSLLLVSLFAVLGIKLYNFTRTETLFTLDKIEYTFASDDHENGPIIIIGTRSDAANIIIPDAIEGHDIVAVGAGAFNNSSVRTLSFLGRIEIGDYAFANSHNLQSVSIESAERIGAEAFYNCGSLKKVSIGSDLKSIGVSAFENCGVLYDISLPDTVETIEDYAFSGCSNIRSLRIPDSTAYVGQSILRGCSALNSLSAPFIGATLSNASNLNYFFGTSSPSTLKNVTVTKMSKIHSYMFSGESYLTSVSFTTPLTEIGSYAFSGCSSLTSFDVPATVESIGTYVFNNCSSLSSISLPQNTTVITDGMFAGCESLKAISLPETLAAVGNGAFKNCYSLSELIIPGTVTHIGYDAIQNCTGLKNLVLPFLGTDKNAEPATLSSLISYGEACSLESFTLLSGTALPNSAFYGFTKLKNVTLPEDLVTIGESCFAGCTSLTSIDLPDMLVSISERAFSSCTALGSVEIPASVAKVGACAFEFCTTLGSIVFRGESTALGKGTLSSCTSLSYVNLPKGATLIPANTFSDCTSLEELILPSGVVEISSYAFLNCYSLKALTLPLNLVSIGNYAFSGCSALPGFTFPSTVETVGRGAFYGCSSITSIVVPETIVNMGSGVFNECLSIESMTAPFPTVFSYGANFSYYFSGRAIPASLKRITVSGVNDLTIPASAFSGCVSLKELTLPDGITSIGQNAFKNCSALTSLVIPDSVEVMGSGMLTGTNALKEITLPYAALSATNEYEGFRYLYYDSYSFYTPQSLETVTLTKAVTIPEYSFQDMTTIKRINLPSTLADIGYYAFSGCSALSTIALPDQLSTIGGYAFNGCYALESLALPNTLSSIGQCAFRDCAALTSLVIPDSVEVMGSGMLTGTNALKEITLPYAALSATNEYEGFRYLYYDSYSFYTPQSLETVTLTKAVTIPEYSFQDMTTIKRINLPSTLADIGYYAFSGCSALSTIALPDQLSTIGGYAFNGCYALESLALPNTLSSIGQCAFRDCAALTSLVIPDSVEVMGSGMLTGTNALKEITLPYAALSATNEYEGFRYLYYDSYSFYTPQSLESVALTKAVAIPEYSFSGMNTIRQIELPFTLTRIGCGAFSGCSALSEITLPTSLNSIESYAFDGCSRLYSVTNLSPNLTHLNLDSIFYETIRIFSSNEEKAQNTTEQGGFSFLRAASGEWYLTGYTMGEEAVNLPTGVSLNEEIIRYAIPKYLFYNDYSLKSVNLSSDVTKICSYAFNSCPSLSEVTADPTTTFTEIGYSAFYNCYSVNKVVIPSSTTRIEDYAFAYTYVSEMTLPASLTYLGNYAFYSCSSLSSVSFESGISLDTIGSYAFYGTPISCVTIPKSIRYIGDNAFAYCYSLTDVVFEDESNLYSINSYAFYNCPITSIALPASLNIIGSYAFSNCANLTEVAFAAESMLSHIYDYAFYNSGVTGIALPASLTYIGDSAFRNCYMLSRLELAEDGMLDSIGSYAFYGAPIPTLSLPDKLTNVGYCAFAYCTSLISVTIRSNFYADYSAFDGCNSIYEVYNLSGTELSVGDNSAFGRVAKNALVVHNDINAERLHDVSVNGFSFKKSGDSWFLMSVADGTDISELILDEFTYNSETVVAFVIHDNAFYGRSDISSLRIGSAVRRIGANAFSGCDNITDLSFDKDCVLEEIESYAFSGCTAVGSIILPNSLISIGDYAFYGCSSANTLLLPADLESIGSYAFQNCYKLYDVMNLSDLDVKARDESSYEYGYAGFYALAVRSSSTPMSVTTVTTDSSVARFVKHSNVWHLVDFAVTDGSGIVEFPRLAVSDTEYGYQIFDYALHTSEGFYGLNLLIYDKVSKIADLAFGYLSGNTIYYNGSRSEWNKLNKSSYAPAVYTYVDCIHYDDEMYWTYDDGGVITTATTPMDIEIISESDCKVQGSAKYTCTLCEYVETRALPLSDEHDFKDGECTVCGAPSPITVTKDNFGTLEFITNDSTYPFVIDNNGVISSQNHSNSTSSTFSITATSDMTVEFQYRTSSESAYDLLYVRLNGATEKSTSGINSYMSYSVTLHVGDVLSITYSKDASVSSGDDCAYIKDLVITF